MQKICIIIPCYNEAHRLDTAKFHDFIQLHSYHFCFVNDGSTDGTSNVISDLKSKVGDKVSLIELKTNSGKGEAVRQGFLRISKTGPFQIIGYLDADLATPLEEIPYLLSYFNNEYQVVFGSRIKRLGTDIQRNLGRHYLGRIFATMVSLVLNLKVYDTQCGAKFFTIEDTAHIFEQPFISRWLFDVEILSRLKQNNPHLFKENTLEVPLRTWREQKNSRIRFIDIIKIPLEFYQIKNTNFL